MKTKQFILAGFFCLVIAAFFFLDLGQYASLEFIKSQQEIIDAYYADYPARSIIAFFFLYVGLITFSLPAAAVLTLAGGAIFGIIWGTVIVSFASIIGSTLAFLDAQTRRLLCDLTGSPEADLPWVITQIADLEETGVVHRLVSPRGGARGCRTRERAHRLPVLRRRRGSSAA